MRKTQRERIDAAIRTLEKMKYGEELCPDDYTLYDIIYLLKSLKPKAYESRRKATCTCGAKSRVINIWQSAYQGYACICGNCNKQGELKDTEIGAIRAWNEMIASETCD